MPAKPICVAIDTPDLEKAVALAKTLKPHVGWAKVGMEFFYAHGLDNGFPCGFYRWEF